MLPFIKKNKKVSEIMVVFQGFFLQVRSNFDKIITSDALDNKGSNLSFFLMQYENSSKWKKTHSLAYFQRFFVYALLRAMSHASIFCQIEGLMKIHNSCKFHEYSVWSCQVINFQRFSHQFSIYEMVLFRVFLGPNSLKYCVILIKFSPEVVFNNRKIVF